MVLAIACACRFALAVVGEPTGQGVTIRTDQPRGEIAVGRSVTWTIQQTQPTTQPLHYRLTENNSKTLESGDLKADETKFVVGKLDHAGWLYLTVENDGPPDTRLLQSAGAIVNAQQIRAAAPVPDDFDTFWDAQLAAIQNVPANPQITVADGEAAGVHYEQLVLDNVGGAHVHAQLAKPDKPGKFPAVVLFQYAGVYPLPKTNVTRPAQEGWLALNVMAHDLPLHESAAYYRELRFGNQPASAYTRIGMESRDTSYFRTMFLGDYQAIEYLRSRDDWDGKVLLVRGESQGGMQSIALAGLDPHVTACAVIVPAGADTLGVTAGRAPGWPYWFRMAENDPTLQAAVNQTSRYYDPANFAHRVKCPAFVALGLRDTTAPPPSVAALSNALNTATGLAIMPNGTHRREHDEVVKQLNQWCNALLQPDAASPLRP